jgi:hypothetical protein
MLRLRRLIAALWFGSAVFLMLAASAAFRAAGHPAIAADVVGSMLTRWHYIALLAPLALFALELRNVRRAILLVLFASVLLAAAQAFVDLRIRAIRAAALQPISELSTEDPVRRRFGMLHGVSMMLLALQAIAAGVTVAARDVQENSVMPTEETPLPPPPDNAQYEAPPPPDQTAPPAPEAGAAPQDEPTVAAEGDERGTDTTGGGP